MAAKKTAKRPTLPRVFELDDSTPMKPVVAFGTYGFPIGRSLEADVRYVADVAMRDARASRDPVAIGCARALDALELLLRRQRTGATAADRKTIGDIEAVARKYLATRKPDEKWNGAALPARAKIDREGQILGLRDFAESVALACTGFEGQPDSRPDAMAAMMTSMVWRAGVVDTKERSRDSDTSALARVVRTRLRPGLARKLTAELLVVLALKACGVSHVDAHNWCKPLA